MWYRLNLCATLHEVQWRHCTSTRPRRHIEGILNLNSEWIYSAKSKKIECARFEAEEWTWTALNAKWLKWDTRAITRAEEIRSTNLQVGREKEAAMLNHRIQSYWNLWAEAGFFYQFWVRNTHKKLASNIPCVTNSWRLQSSDWSYDMGSLK